MDINWIQYILVLAIVLINHSIRKLNTVIFFVFSCLENLLFKIRALKIIIRQFTMFSCWQSVYRTLTSTSKLYTCYMYACVCVVILFGYPW